MKINGFHAPPMGGKKVFVISLIMALFISTVSAFGVFAAPSPETTGSKNLQRQVEAARAWYNSFISNRTGLMSAIKKEPNRTQYWLAQYTSTLRQAEAIVAGHTAISTNQQQKLMGWLRAMHELQGRLTKAANNPPHHSH